jgi:hypothetical protein
MMTLDGIIGVVSCFPPASHSAELEMVADGLAPRQGEGGTLRENSQGLGSRV